jgi:hypothetical protein
VAPDEGELVPKLRSNQLIWVGDDAVSFWREALMYYTDRFSVSIDLTSALASLRSARCSTT